MDRVRLAIVGCGSISVMNGPGYVMDDRCEVAALCDPLQERAETRAREWEITPKIYTRLEEVLDDPDIDAIELLTPTPMHAGQVVAALEAGKHVSCQKPICNSLEELETIAAAVARAKTMFRVTENLLHYPPLVKAKELLHSGAIGEPSVVRFRVIRGRGTLGRAITIEPDSKVWRRDPNTNTGGFLFDGAWHMYSVAMDWLGPPERVLGMMTTTEDFWEELPSTVVWKLENSQCQVVFQFLLADMPMRNDYVASDEFYELQGSEGLLWGDGPQRLSRHAVPRAAQGRGDYRVRHADGLEGRLRRRGQPLHRLHPLRRAADYGHRLLQACPGDHSCRIPSCGVRQSSRPAAHLTGIAPPVLGTSWRGRALQ